MLKRLDIAWDDGRAPTAEAAGVRPSPIHITLPASTWDDPSFDPLELDAVVTRAAERTAVVLWIVEHHATAPAPANDGATEPAGARAQPRPRHRPLEAVAAEVGIRYQRFIDRRNAGSATPLFDRVLAHHRAMHDLTKPLCAADLDHAIDCWRWVLRLDEGASTAVQIAALFHDVERLVGEPDVRVEQHAPDYAAFKARHAVTGARLAATALQRLGVDDATVARVAELVARHETPGDDPERRLINDADGLSFFSLNACGFMRYYGAAHTERKVAYTLSRLSRRGRAYLGVIRHRADIAAMLARAAVPPAEAEARR
jgi:hypothetical protein